MVIQERRPGLRDVVAHIVGGASKDWAQSEQGGLSGAADDPLEQDLIAYMRTAPEAERRSLMQIIRLCISDKESKEKALEAVSSGAANRVRDLGAYGIDRPLSPCCGDGCRR